MFLLRPPNWTLLDLNLPPLTCQVFFFFLSGRGCPRFKQIASFLPRGFPPLGNGSADRCAVTELEERLRTARAPGSGVAGVPSRPQFLASSHGAHSVDVTWVSIMFVSFDEHVILFWTHY